MITRILRRFVLAAAGLAVALAGGAPAARADFLLSSGGPGQPDSGVFTNLTEGYSFTVGTQPVAVTRLGLLDLHFTPGVGFVSGGGLFEAHQVGLWTSTGTLLGSVTVPAGTAAPVVNDFRYASLSSPVFLSPGQTYVLGASYPTNFATNASADLTRRTTPAQMAALMNSNFTFVSGLAGINGFVFPTIPLAAAPVGPNLEFSPVPEPATLASLGAGLVSLAGYGWRRRRGQPVATA